ncbi:MAG: ABC transporter substrate-binding protein [Elainella sp.]
MATKATKENPLALLLTLLITLGLLGGAAYWVYGRLTTGSSTSGRASERFSTGERQLIKTTTTPAKEAGIMALAAGDFPKAVEWFEASLKLEPNDPETLIYLNNARLRTAPIPPNTIAINTIAVSVPIGTKINIAQEILRGVAQAQDQINRQGGINGAGLSVEIINDDNDAEVAQQIAETLVKDDKILAVVAHNTGDASLAAAPIYQQNGIVMISPTTFNPEVARVDNYIFRAVPTPQIMAAPLVNYILERSKPPTLLVCYDSQAPDQVVFTEAVVNTFKAKGGQTVDTDCNYSTPGFDAQRAVEQGIAQGATGIFLGTNVNNFDPTVEVIRANNRRLPLYSSATLYTQEVIQQGQQATEGLVLVAPWSPEAHPEFAQQARDLWRATVNWRTATAYDATRALIAGLQRSNTRNGLQQVLQDPGFSTTGSGDPVEFSNTRDRRLQPVLMQVQPDSSSGSGYKFVYLPK